MKIFVKILYTTGQSTITLDCDASETLVMVKAKVHDAEGIPPDEQSLMFMGQPVEDRRRLSSYDIREGSTLVLVLIVWMPAQVAAAVARAEIAEARAKQASEYAAHMRRLAESESAAAAERRRLRLRLAPWIELLRRPPAACAKPAVPPMPGTYAKQPALTQAPELRVVPTMAPPAPTRAPPMRAVPIAKKTKGLAKEELPKPPPTPMKEETTAMKEEPTPMMEEPTPVKEEPTPMKGEPTATKEEPTPMMEEPTPVKEEPTPMKGEPTIAGSDSPSARVVSRPFWLRGRQASERSQS